MKTAAWATTLLLATTAAAASPRDVALLVLETNQTRAIEALRPAIADPEPLSRTAAARVAVVRSLPFLLPDLRQALVRETDLTAAREQIRALAILGTADDVAFAVTESAKRPRSVDSSLALAVARRGTDALDLYATTLKALRSIPRDEFFRTALWGRDPTLAESRLVGAKDVEGWAAMLRVLSSSGLQPNANVAAVAAKSSSEEIRNATVWWAVRTSAGNPAGVSEEMKQALAVSDGITSDREAFGRELMRRASGAARSDDPRWSAWLETQEADDLLGKADNHVYALLTDREYALRRKRCGTLPFECAMPAVRPRATMKATIAPHAVSPAAFALPDQLPAGLAEVVAGHCAGGWLGLAAVSVDSAGRVRQLGLDRFGGDCRKEVEVLLRLSLATNIAMNSPMTQPDVVLARARGAALCLDEEAPSDTPSQGLVRLGADVTPPRKTYSVDPVLPPAARAKMGRGQVAMIILEAIISTHGCVRSIRPIAETPFPDLNGAAILALSQWKFSPGTLDGSPVDVIYNLTVSISWR